MARAGLSTGFTTLSNPYSMEGPDLSIYASDIGGAEAMQDAAASGAMMRGRITEAVSGLLPTIEAPPSAAAPQAQQAPASTLPLYNAATKEFAVAGQRFGSDDATKILQSEALLGQPTPPDTDLGPGWQPITTESYQKIIAGIKDPSFGAMFGKGFEIGTQNLKTLYGSALQSVTGGEYGGGMVKSAEEQLAKLQPYQRDVADGITADWFATSIGQQGPMILESIATALAGAAIGSAAGGPGGTAIGTLAGLFGKKAVKEKILEAAAKYNTAKAAGVALNSTPELIAATKVLRNAGAAAGAVAGSFLGNEVIAAGDIYQEGAAAGTVSPLEAWAKGVPYAALDLLPEVAFLGRALRGGRAALPRGSTFGQYATEYGLKRFGAGLAVGGLVEGGTETGQEAIVLQAAEKDMGSPEALNRYLNSFAAGFAVGGLMGGAANLRSRPTDETNLLDNVPPPPAEPEQTPPAGPPVGTQFDLFPEEPALAGPPRPQTFAGVSTERRATEPAPPSVAPGQLGLLEPTQLPLEGFTTTQDWASPTALENTQEESLPNFAAAAREWEASQVNPAQGALQFAPPAPIRGGVGNVGQLLLRERDYPLAQAQQEEQKAQDFPLAEAQQQLQLAINPIWTGQESTGLLPTVAPEDEALTAATLNAARNAYNQTTAIDQQAQEAEAALLNLGVIGRSPAPITRAKQPRPTQPTQLILPDVLSQPKPTLAEKLKQGKRKPPPVEEVAPATQKELEAAGQLRLFDDEGQPTTAARKGAGLKRKRPKPTEDKTTKQRGPTDFRGKTAREKATEEAAAKAKAKREADEEAQRKVDEAEAQRKADEEAQRKADEEAQRKADEAAAAKKKADALKKGATAKKRAAAKKAEEELAKKRAAKKPGELILEDDGIEGREVPFEEVPGGNDAFQYAVGKVEADGATAVFRRRASERGTYGGWRVETDVNKLRQKDAVQEQGADKVSARNEPGTGEGVGSKVRGAKKPTGKGKPQPEGKAKEPTAGSVSEEQAAGQVEKEVTPAKKSEAAQAAATEEQVSVEEEAKPSEPVMIQFVTPDGKTMTADAREMLRATNEQMDKYTALLNCLKG